jgi:probable F420-dependent oxidoreductase
VKLGLSPDTVRDARALAELARRVEDAGFASLWAPDHLAFFGSPTLDPFQALTAFAAGSRALELGTSVLVMPLRAPALVAKAAASLDALCGGRLTLGVGVGGEFAGEYEAAGVPLGERGARLDEGLAVLRHLWRGDPAPFHGRFSTLRAGTLLNPLPVRPGGPPLWIGGRADVALRRAARAGDGYLGFLLDPGGFEKRIARIQSLASRKVTGALLTFCCVDDDASGARERVIRQLETNYGVPMRAAVERYAIVGSESECLERIAAHARAGVEHLVLTSPFRGADFDAQLPRLAQLVAR